jgi:hypothetical protein
MTSVNITKPCLGLGKLLQKKELGASAPEHRRAGRPVPIVRAVNSGSCLLLGGAIRRVPASSPNDGTISASK